MPGHLLGMLEPAVVFQVNRDTGRPPSVTSDRGEKASRLGPLPNRSPGVVSVQSASRYLRSNRIDALEQGLPALEACGDNVLVQYLLQQVALASRVPCRLYHSLQDCSCSEGTISRCFSAQSCRVRCSIPLKGPLFASHKRVERSRYAESMSGGRER